MPNPDKAFWDMVEGRAAAGTPSAKLLGWRCLELDLEKGTIRVEFQPSAAFRNPLGNVQGGFVAAMLDETLGPLVYATLAPGEFNTSLEFKVSFIQPIKLGTLLASGRIVHRGRSVVFAEADLRDTEGLLPATATTTMKIVHAKTGFDAA